jgi:hypothetical protein
MTPFHVKALALTLLCALLTGCLPPPARDPTNAPTQAEQAAQDARRAERWARFRAGLAASAREDERKAKPYQLDCRTNAYGTTTCEDGDHKRVRCHTDAYGNTHCEEEPY